MLVIVGDETLRKYNHFESMLFTKVCLPSGALPPRKRLEKRGLPNLRDCDAPVASARPSEFKAGFRASLIQGGTKLTLNLLVSQIPN